ncbi:MAG: zinc-binding dehydrogenase [Solirubrobacteraceae bacterium]|nr:MAG: NADPH:quinone reductase [Solirubrobacterales bacterium]
MRAIRIKQFGGPEVLDLTDLPDPEPDSGEALVRVTRAGMNFADIHAREDAYLAPQHVPFVPGVEAAGVLESDAGKLKAGQRVVCMLASGGYAELVCARIERVYPIPDGLDDGSALALLGQGLTAWHLYRTAAKLQPDESVVVHAAGGGVGTLAVQLAKPMGAGRVIATASTAEKRELALELGADAAVDVNDADLVAAIREANCGEGVDVVLEMAGGDVFDASLDALAPFGRVVVHGIASREQRTVSNAKLLRTSRGVVGFWLAHCLARREMVEAPLADLFERAARGELRAVIGTTYPLSQVRRAHDDLQGRRTAGKLLLDPSA